MKRSSVRRIAWGLVGLVATVGAQQPKWSEVRSRDFAFGMTLEPTRKADVHTALIPPDVYRGVTRSDLGDLRVFNAAGKPVPFAVRPVGPNAQGAAPRVRVPLFPVHGPAGSAIDGLRLNVNRQTDGTLIALETTEARPVTDTLRAYILDGTAAREGAAALWLDWPEDGPDFVAPLNIEVSEDLARWRRVATESIVRLTHEGHRLVKRRVPVSFFRANYLRLTWREELPTKIIDARLELVVTTREPRREKITVEVADRPEEHVYHFDLGGPIPVDRIGVTGLEMNTVAPVELYSSASSEGPWQPRTKGLLYRMRSGELRLNSDPFSVSPNIHRHWALHVDPRGGGLGRVQPRLELSWVPLQLVFIPRGESPFLLAYGSRRAEPSLFDAKSLLSIFPSEYVHALPHQNVAMREQKILGGPMMLQPPFDLPWREGALWVVLIAGVIALGWMSLRLVSQITSSAETSD